MVLLLPLRIHSFTNKEIIAFNVKRLGFCTVFWNDDDADDDEEEEEEAWLPAATAIDKKKRQQAIQFSAGNKSFEPKRAARKLSLENN